MRIAIAMIILASFALTGCMTRNSTPLHAVIPLALLSKVTVSVTNAATSSVENATTAEGNSADLQNNMDGKPGEDIMDSVLDGPE